MDLAAQFMASEKRDILYTVGVSMLHKEER
jgi:hypothetical protein